jgi:hypothetical protein
MICITYLQLQLQAQQSSYTYDLPGNLTSVIGTNAVAPSITKQPQSALLYSNNPVSVSVVVSGAGISYQWLSNGVPILGAINDTLIFPTLTSTNGNFSVIIGNSSGSVTSTPAAIWLDSRGVGMPDWWQLKYFGNLTQSPYGDYDDDGVDNLDEYLEGTNPTNAASFNPRLYIQSPSNGRVVASPDQPFYTMGQVITLTAIPDTGQDFLGWGGAATGTKTSIALVMSTNQTVSASFGIPLPVALDNPNLVWTTGGSAAWYGQTAVSEDGTNAAQTGLISNSQQTWLQGVASNLTQNCQLSFWWNVSSQSPDNLAFALDGTQLYSIASEAVGWQHVIVNLTAGTHTLLWTYTKGGGDVPTGIPFTDSGWVDQVQIGIGPAITNQPASQIVAQGGKAALSVAASGTAPNYQWYFNGTTLPGQNNASLTLNNIQPTSAGSYFAIASNPFGVATSAVAVVIVNSGSCTPAPKGLVSWWTGNGNALDSAGGNNGTVQGGVTYTNGIVGQAFSFNGTSEAVLIPYSSRSDLSAMPGWTIEAWVNPASFNNSSWPTIFAKGHWEASLGLNAGTGKLESWINNASQLVGTTAVPLGQWSHVALVYDGTNRIFYVNGAFAGAGSAPVINPDITNSFIGNVVPNDSASFNGEIDEVTIYNRALSPAEIAANFDAGSAGMCEPIPYFSTSANAAQWATNGFSLQVSGLTGQGNVVIYSSTNLVSWKPIYTNPPVFGSLQFLDTNATKVPMMFYRILQQ